MPGLLPEAGDCPDKLPHHGCVALLRPALFILSPRIGPRAGAVAG